MYFGIKFYAEDPCKLKEEITRYSIDFVFEQCMDSIYGRLYLIQIGVKHLDGCLPRFVMHLHWELKFKLELSGAGECLMIDVCEQWHEPG